MTYGVQAIRKNGQFYFENDCTDLTHSRNILFLHLFRAHRFLNCGINTKVQGQLNDFNDDDEASIDEDRNSDGGEVSQAGSGGAGVYGGGGNMVSDEYVLFN